MRHSNWRNATMLAGRRVSEDGKGNEEVMDN